MSRAAAQHWLALRLPRLARAWRDRMGRRARRFPAILSVELTNHCNADCIMCPRQVMTRPRGVMDPALFRRIVDEAAQNQQHLRLFQPFLFGEGLIHPEFAALLAEGRARLPRVAIYVSTNGMLLDEARARAILAAGVDKLNVDIDGLTPAVAESVRVGTRLPVVTANVERFLALRRELGGRTKLRVSIIRLRANRHEIADFVAHWRRLADHVQVVDCNTWLGAISTDIAADDAIQDISPPFDFPCWHPYEELAIAWDGRASLCCLDFDLRHVVGDVNHEPVAEIWHGRRLEAVRAAMESNKYEVLPICRTCNAARFQQKKLWRYLWLAR